MNNNLSRFADSKVYFQCPICTKSMDIQGNSLICRHGHCFDISRYGYVNLLLKSSPKTNYSKRSFDNRHQILEYGMYDVVLEKIIQFISDTPSIRNILDVGCGKGAWLSQWRELYTKDIQGLDGSYVDKQTLLIPKDNFLDVDLTDGFQLNRKFSLVQCLEVAEHLDEKFADILIKSIISHGDIVSFSAAQPGQGGEHHVNE